MSLYSDNSNRQAAQSLVGDFVRTNLSILLFLVLAGGGMMTVYWFFTPPATGSAEAVAVSSEGDSLSALIYKSVPAKPVAQRFVQTSGPLHVAVIAGHKDSDAGAVCADGLTEAQVNLIIAEQVVGLLHEKGIQAEIFSEFDPRLQNYSGTALVSLHADSCDYINDLATGFKLSGSSFTDSSQLENCVETAYQKATHLPYHANTITEDMTDYHAFREVAPGVQAVILETGFMYLDRELLTTNSSLPAGAVAEGVLCFLNSREQMVN